MKTTSPSRNHKLKLIEKNMMIHPDWTYFKIISIKQQRQMLVLVPVST